MVTTITLLCLVVCPSDPPPLLQTINDEWRTHTADPFLDPTFTLLNVHLPQPPPRSTTTREPVPREHSSGVEQWRPLVTQYFAGDQVDRALCVMEHESGGDPGANNPTSTAAGLFQFLRSTWDKMVPREATGGSYDSGQVYDPTSNIAAADWLSTNVGWSQWSPYQRGECH